jgi:ATP-dependent helicase/DNAse subunit B
MKLSNNGFYKYSKILNNNQINNLIGLVGDKINEGATDILNGRFDVNPKQLDGTNVACEYCTFRDMCYMKDSDIITLKENKDLAFLGGDNHE